MSKSRNSMVLREEARPVEIRFMNRELRSLRELMLADLSQEYYACLLGKRRDIGDLCVITVVEARFPKADSYRHQAGTSLRVSG